MTTRHPDYATLAARIAISNLHKETTKHFSKVVDDLYTYINPKNNKPSPMISKETYEAVMENAEMLNSAMVYDRDFGYVRSLFISLWRTCGDATRRITLASRPSSALTFFASTARSPSDRSTCSCVSPSASTAKTSTRSLSRTTWCARLSYLARVSSADTRAQMSERYFTHASPTLFNAGTPHPQLSSCFLVNMKDDSIDGIYDTLKTCAMISKTAGGIGLSIHCIRATGSYIAGTNGELEPSGCSLTFVTRSQATRMASCPCFESTTIRLATSTRAATSDRAPSPSTWNRGTPTSSNSSTCARTTARRRSALATSSTLSGSPTCASSSYSLAIESWLTLAQLHATSRTERRLATVLPGRSARSR